MVQSPMDMPCWCNMVSRHNFVRQDNIGLTIDREVLVREIPTYLWQGKSPTTTCPFTVEEFRAAVSPHSNPRRGKILEVAVSLVDQAREG